MLIRSQHKKWPCCGWAEAVVITRRTPQMTEWAAGRRSTIGPTAGGGRRRRRGAAPAPARHPPAPDRHSHPPSTHTSHGIHRLPAPTPVTAPTGTHTSHGIHWLPAPTPTTAPTGTHPDHSTHWLPAPCTEAAMLVSTRAPHRYLQRHPHMSGHT